MYKLFFAFFISILITGCNTTWNNPNIEAFYTTLTGVQSSSFVALTDNIGIYAKLTDHDGDLSSIHVRKITGVNYEVGTVIAEWDFPVSGSSLDYNNINVEPAITTGPFWYDIKAYDKEGHTGNVMVLSFNVF